MDRESDLNEQADFLLNNGLASKIEEHLGKYNGLIKKRCLVLKFFYNSELSGLPSYGVIQNILGNLDSLSKKGCCINLVDAKDLNAGDLEREYDSIAHFGVRFKVRTVGAFSRRTFGTRHPALFVYEKEGMSLLDVFPKETGNGGSFLVIKSIEEFLFLTEELTRTIDAGKEMSPKELLVALIKFRRSV